MLDVYADFAENHMGVPVVRGVKTANERFAGALDTYTIEALMQDGKALQSGTSHFLGQNFAKAFDVTFMSREGKSDYVWATSWGVSTRLMGALIMAHSDDNGLVLPPRLAPTQVVIVPVYKKEEERAAIAAKADEIVARLRARGISVLFDNNDKKKPGWKFAEYELKGFPIRIALGPRDLARNEGEVHRRDTMEKMQMSLDGIEERLAALLDEMQANIFAKAKAYRDSHITRVETYDEFKEVLQGKGGFVSAHWDGTTETEVRIKEETKATIRCIPLDGEPEEGRCILTGKPSHRRVLFAVSY